MLLPSRADNNRRISICHSQVLLPWFLRQKGYKFPYPIDIQQHYSRFFPKSQVVFRILLSFFSKYCLLPLLTELYDFLNTSRKRKAAVCDSSLSDSLLCVNQIAWNNFPNLLSASTPLAVSAAPIASIFSPPFFGGCLWFSPFPLTRLWQSRQLPAKDLLFENFSMNFFGQGQRLKCDKNRPAGRRPTGRWREVFCCLFTWYSSYS